ncbi:pol polyprotein [Nephila pilipes]|uniref:Pol polyprotein n=1 Tax=Nephila pilipes TaxID=299642 RepID=A0A8X6TDX8_NEPPI|nr:pol polyprotein [Nephila pilipes]
MPNPINYDEIAKSQESDLELQNLINNPQGLQLKKIVMPNSDIPLFCDLSTGTARPYIPKDYRQRIFSQLHNMSHPEVLHNELNTPTITEEIIQQAEKFYEKITTHSNPTIKGQRKYLRMTGRHPYPHQSMDRKELIRREAT